MTLTHLVRIMIVLALGLISGCVRDLSDKIYTRDSTEDLTFQGEVIEAKPVAIKTIFDSSNNYEYTTKVETSKLNTRYCEGSPTICDAIASAKSTGLVTIIQKKDKAITVGQKVYVLISPKVSRVIKR